MDKQIKRAQIPAIGAIATPSHFNLTMCMVDSFLEHHPQSKVYILQIGGEKKLSAPKRPQITIINEHELNLPQYGKMRRQYNNFELCNALKPFLLRYIFDNTESEKIGYFDSDLFIYENLDEEIWQKLDNYSVMLTPHLTKVSTDESYWQDLEILRRGVFNGGFVGLRKDENARKFLDWWGFRLIHGGYYRLEESLNCDQGWLDLVSNFDINLFINRHPGINVAFWNLSERKIEFKNEKAYINGKPLLFFHFSGYSPQDPHLLSKNSFTITFEKFPIIRSLFDQYREKLLTINQEFSNLQNTKLGILSSGSQETSGVASEFAVSVVIPCHNAARFLHQAISSVLSQTLKSLEVIAVDDGSTDETAKILASFGNLIKVFRQPNSGVSVARNLGIEAAKGEFIAFLDADDYYLDPGKLEEQLYLARQTGSDIVQSGWTLIDQKGELSVDVEEWKICPELNLENWLKAQAILPSALFIRRSALLSVENFDRDLQYAEDVDLLLRLLQNGYKADWLKKCAVAYRQHENNATKSLTQRIEPAERVWDKFFSQSGLPPVITKLESLLRQSVYLYLAFECAEAGEYSLMKELLLKSRKYAKFKAGGALIYWLDYFKKRSEIYKSRKFDTLTLISRPEWIELTEILSGSSTEVKTRQSKAFQKNIDKIKPNAQTHPQQKVSSYQKQEREVSFPQKINLKPAFKNSMGIHRSGWNFALNSLNTLHSDKGVFVEDAIENRFAFPIAEGLKNYRKGWIGFFHHPPEMPYFYEKQRVPEVVLQNKEMQKALETCYGVFCFSENYRQWLAERLKIPVVKLFHPTETPENVFTPEKFLANPVKRIVQVGHWLRKVHSIYFLPTKLKRTIVHQDFPHVRDYFEAEKQAFGLRVNENGAEKLAFLNNDDYDQLLSENIVFLDLHATAVNNAIIECIVRNTPVLVNPLPAVIEYLGEDYPFYFSSRNEAAAKSEDISLIEETYKFLLVHPIKEKLTADYFLRSIAESEIYERLSLPKK